MGYPRHMTVDPATPRFYHCVSRCVRRAWLCGNDPLSDRNFDHRRGWIEQRLRELAESFSISLYAWAVMSNHTHVVLRVDPEGPLKWSDEEVARRWARIARTLDAPSDREVERRVAGLLRQPERLEELRRRLGSLSWFMRFLNECIARQANAEDECTGRFWEGRYRCQALLDDAAVLACMAYVDLNPIRAGITDDLEQSEFTSLSVRLRTIRESQEGSSELLRPIGGERIDGGPVLSLARYLELLEWTRRLSRGPTTPHSEPSESILPTGPPRVRDWWIGCVLRIEQVFGSAVGLPRTLRRFASSTGRRWVRGVA